MQASGFMPLSGKITEKGDYVTLSPMTVGLTATSQLLSLLLSSCEVRWKTMYWHDCAERMVNIAGRAGACVYACACEKREAAASMGYFDFSGQVEVSVTGLLIILRYAPRLEKKIWRN